MPTFLEALNEGKHSFVQLRKICLILFEEHGLNVVYYIAIEQMAEKGFSLCIMIQKFDLLLRLGSGCLPLMLIDLLVEALYNLVMPRLNRLEELHYLLKGLMDVALDGFLVHPHKEDPLYELV